MRRLVGLAAGRVPAAAGAIAVQLRHRFDDRYAKAIATLRALRDRLLGAGRRADWQRASEEIIGPEFTADVEAGRIEAKVASWH